jgi:hypothetical protein
MFPAHNQICPIHRMQVGQKVSAFVLKFKLLRLPFFRRNFPHRFAGRESLLHSRNGKALRLWRSTCCLAPSSPRSAGHPTASGWFITYWIVSQPHGLLRTRERRSRLTREQSLFMTSRKRKAVRWGVGRNQHGRLMVNGLHIGITAPITSSLHLEECPQRLFKRKELESPLLWSPDSRLVLYFCCCFLRPTLQCMCDVGRWFVRRLADHSEIRVAEESPFQGKYVWIKNQARR